MADNSEFLSPLPPSRAQKKRANKRKSPFAAEDIVYSPD